MVTKFEEIIVEEGYSDKDLAAIFESTPTTFYRYRKGLRVPENKMMKNICNYFKGRVTPSDFYDIKPTSTKSQDKLTDGGVDAS